MRLLPSSLLAKVMSAQQTKYNNADPKMHIILQRMHRYIEQGALMAPVTVKDEAGAGSWDLDMRREDHLKAPDKLYKIYVISGQAHVARTDYVDALDILTSDNPDQIVWEYLYEVGGDDTVDVSLEFDGFWMPASRDAEICFDSPARWTLKTTGEPWYCWVDSAGDLWTQQSDDVGTKLLLATGGVTKLSMIRGWKSVVNPEMDQGLIVGYIQNGIVKYRNYCEQADATTFWESSKDVNEFDTSINPAMNLALFRTNDFRIGFMAEINNEIFWSITERRWAGMGVPAELINVAITDFGIEMLPVMHMVVGDGPYPTNQKTHQKGHWNDSHNECVLVSIADCKSILLHSGEETTIRSIENIMVETVVTGEDCQPSTGDGTTIDYQMVWIPNVETETVYVDGVPQIRGVDYTIDGRDIIFNVPPPVGVSITVDYEWNNWGIKIKIVFTNGITSINGNGWTVVDDGQTEYVVGNTLIGVEKDSWKIHDEYPAQSVIITVADFNDADGDLSVAYSGASQTLKGEIGQSITSDLLATFTPINLQPSILGPPGLEEMWNE